MTKHVFMGSINLPIHFMSSAPEYRVLCGADREVFYEGHGARIYEQGVTCKACLRLLEEQKESESNAPSK